MITSTTASASSTAAKRYVFISLPRNLQARGVVQRSAEAQGEDAVKVLAWPDRRALSRVGVDYDGVTVESLDSSLQAMVSRSSAWTRRSTAGSTYWRPAARRRHRPVIARPDPCVDGPVALRWPSGHNHHPRRATARRLAHGLYDRGRPRSRRDGRRVPRVRRPAGPAGRAEADHARDGAGRALPRPLPRESQLAASLDHSNVVPIYDAGEADGHLYIAMRYVEGTDLGTLLEERRLDPEGALRSSARSGPPRRSPRPGSSTAT